jgi:hypothetical protein
MGRRNTTMLVAIVRVYEHHTDAADAVQELRKAGVPEYDISVITRDDRVAGAARGAEIGAAVGALAGLMTGLGLVAIPGIGLSWRRAGLPQPPRAQRRVAWPEARSGWSPRLA